MTSPCLVCFSSPLSVVSGAFKGHSERSDSESAGQKLTAEVIETRVGETLTADDHMTPGDDVMAECRCGCSLIGSGDCGDSSVLKGVIWK